DRGDEENAEERPSARESTQRCRPRLLSLAVSRDGKNWYHHKKSAPQHGCCKARVVPEGVGVQTAKRRAVVPNRRGVGVENLRGPMTARIGNARCGEFRGDRNRGEDKNGERRDEHRKHGHLYVEGLNFFA